MVHIQVKDKENEEVEEGGHGQKRGREQAIEEKEQVIGSGARSRPDKVMNPKSTVGIMKTRTKLSLGLLEDPAGASRPEQDHQSGAWRKGDRRNYRLSQGQ